MLALTVFVVSVSANLAAQELDRSLQRIMLALERPPLIVRDKPSEDSQRTMERQVLGSSVFETLPGRPKLGPLEFVAPQFRGEFVRLALPIGSYLSHGFRMVAATKLRRREQAARRDVEADLRAWKERAPTP